MTLSEFYKATAGMPGSTILKVLAPWGGISDTTLVTVEDLVEGNPIREEIPPNSILLAKNADY